MGTEGMKCPHGHLETFFESGTAYTSRTIAKEACRTGCLANDACMYADLFFGSWENSSTHATCYLKSAECGDYASNLHGAYSLWIRPSVAATTPAPTAPSPTPTVEAPGWKEGMKCPRGHLETFFESGTAYTSRTIAKEACRTGCLANDACMYADLFFGSWENSSTHATCYLKGNECGDYASNLHGAYSLWTRPSVAATTPASAGPSPTPTFQPV